jgi:hypothetical protein
MAVALLVFLSGCWGGAGIAPPPQPPGGSVGTEEPMIYGLETHEDDKVTIHGDFGTDPGASNRKVTVGGTEVTVNLWASDRIEVAVPRTGAGSSGDVVVTVSDQVRVLELRYYQPFWYAASHKRFRYDRRTQYQVPVPADVQTVEVAGQNYTLAGGRFALQAVDHCLSDERTEVLCPPTPSAQEE